MKRTLLQIVQSILNDMDSEEVNTISDSNEAEQVASVVRDVYYNIIAARSIPEHSELLKLTAASDSNYPTHFHYPDNVKNINTLWYENSDGDYVKVKWVDPLDFINRTDSLVEDYVTVYDKNGGTKLRIGNDDDPTYYTSFDDYWVVMNSYDSSVDSTLQASKIRAYGVKYPDFDVTDDSFVPDLDETLFPYLIAEAKSVAMSLFKGSPDAKIEQHSRRLKAYIQNDKYRTTQKPRWPNYGR